MFFGLDEATSAYASFMDDDKPNEHMECLRNLFETVLCVVLMDALPCPGIYIYTYMYVCVCIYI